MSLTETRPDGGSDSPLGIPLPAGSGANSIRRRRRRQERRQRRLFLIAFVTLLVSGAAAIGLPHLGRQLAGPDAAHPPAAAAPIEPKVLLAHRHPDGTARSITIFSDGDAAQSIVLIPAGTMAEVPSLGLEPLGRALQIGGPTRLRSTVENLLGIRISDVIVADDADFSALAEPLGELKVQVPERVEQVTEDGTVDVLYEPGLLRLAPEEVPAFLSAKGSATDLSVLARHQGFWEAVLGRISDEELTPGGPAPLAEVLVSLAGGEAVRSRLLPVEPLGQEAVPGADGTSTELYQADPQDLARFIESTFPGSEAPVDRPRAQVLNGTGGVEVSARAAEKLVPAGIQVALTGNAPRFDYRQTQIVFYEASQEDIAAKARDALGVGRLVLSRRPLGVVDLTIIIGSDFGGSQSAPAGEPSPESQPTNRRT